MANNPYTPSPWSGSITHPIERIKKSLGVRSYKWQLLFPKTGEITEREKAFGSPKNTLENALDYLDRGLHHKDYVLGDPVRLNIWDSQLEEKTLNIGSLDLTRQWTVGYLLGPRRGVEVYSY